MTLLLWLYHNVWGNLVASGITATIAYMKLKRQHDRQHQQLKDHIDYQFTKATERNTK